jgi:hypothetical protein
MAIKSKQPRRAEEEDEVKCNLVQALCDTINCLSTDIYSLQTVSKTICSIYQRREKKTQFKELDL